MSIPMPPPAAHRCPHDVINGDRWAFDGTSVGGCYTCQARNLRTWVTPSAEQRLAAAQARARHAAPLDVPDEDPFTPGQAALLATLPHDHTDMARWPHSCARCHAAWTMGRATR